MSIFPTTEEAMREHRQRKTPVFQVQPGDQVEIAGWPAMVRNSEPWSDFIWSLELDGHHADGDPFTTIIRIPADVRVYVRRRPRRPR